MDILRFSIFLPKLFSYLLNIVGSDVVVPLVGDGSQLLLLPTLLLLDGDGPIEVTPVLEDRPLPLQLSDLEQEGVSSPGQHEVKVQVDLSPICIRVLDLCDHLLIGRVGAQV